MSPAARTTASPFFDTLYRWPSTQTGDPRNPPSTRSRQAMIVKGPGIKPGSVFDGNVVNYDFLPTFVDWAGGHSKKLQNIDGVSLADYMAGKKPDEAFLNRNLYSHYPHYRSSVPHSS